jgi:hypothetical protein
VATIEVVAEALEATAARLQAAGAGVNAVARGLRSSAADAGDPAVAAGLDAFVSRVGQTVPALVTSHAGVAARVAAAANRYRSAEVGIGRLIDADTTSGPVGVIGQASAEADLTSERWGQRSVPAPRTTQA